MCFGICTFGVCTYAVYVASLGDFEASNLGPPSLLPDSGGYCRS